MGEGERRRHELRALLLSTAADAGGGLLALLGPTTQQTSPQRSPIRPTLTKSY
ncbi:hypothetical protein [Streptomyces sp. YIM 121038]|uniref:hypothetical protein n=1 Tax=Streptomyces sp. YIM 121038 TaxID=2136401 RepID=UPI0020176645|nr:hypothetical protein [Streptomyces sp. YIM 121038]